LSSDLLETTKYIIHLDIYAEGVIEKSDVIGAVFGQSEGLLGDNLDLRELQKTGRVGRIDVNISSKEGKSTGTVLIPSSLDKVETAILAAALETIDRIGPCMAKIKVDKISDVRAEKRKQIIDRAQKILKTMFKNEFLESDKIIDAVRQAVRIEEISEYGASRLPAGPHVKDSDAIIIVEGRSDVLNLLKYGIKNTVAVEGTNVPKDVIDLSKTKITTAFLDGDRGGELILKELLQTADIDFVAFSPEGKCVEDMSQKEVLKALRNKVPVEQAIIHLNVKKTKKNEEKQKKLVVKKEDTGEVEVAIVDEGDDIVEAEVNNLEKVDAAVVSKEEKIKEEPGKEVLKESKTLAKYRDYINKLNGTLTALLLNETDAVIKEIAVRDLAKELKEVKEKVKTVIFDGVITQRILDISADKGIRYIIGVKIGNIVKKPVSVKIFTLDDL
jgi:DNA primase